MAEKLEITLSRGTATVSHRGDEVTIQLGEWLNIPQETFFDREALLAHCEQHGILLATLQEGFAQHLINVRAKARPADLPPEEKGGASIPQRITPDGAQERVDNYKPEPRRQGKKPLTREEKKKELIKMGFTDNQAEAILNMEEQQD